jgi:hypothetical protein
MKTENKFLVAVLSLFSIGCLVFGVLDCEVSKPRFKVGDCVLTGTDVLYRILEVTKEKYLVAYCVGKLKLCYPMGFTQEIKYSQSDCEISDKCGKLMTGDAK